MTTNAWAREYESLAEETARRAAFGTRTGTYTTYAPMARLVSGASTVFNTDQPYDLGPYVCENPHHALLHSVLETMPLIHAAEGFALEFGVGDGASLNCIARHLPVVGFDSFQGLPEDWRPGFEKGAFAHDFFDVLSRTPEYCMLKPGLFEDTVPPFFAYAEGIRTLSLVHIDCDLYSSTKTVLEHLPLEHMVRSRTVVIFDEFQGYPGADEHEEKAWREYAAQTGIQWDVLGHGEQSWGIKIK